MCTVNCLSDDTGSQTPSPYVCDNSIKYNQFLKYNSKLPIIKLIKYKNDI